MNTNVSKLAKRTDMHVLRKLWHISFGSACLFLYMKLDLAISFWGYFAISAALGGFMMDFARLRNQRVNNLVLKMLGPLMRSSEKDGFSGLPFYALGVGLSILFFEEKIAVLSIMFLVFADPIASFVGVNYGKDKILPNKSLQGAIAAFLVCKLLTIAYLYNSGASDLDLILFSSLAGLVGSLSELASSFNIDDNLTIPVLSGAGLSVLNLYFHIF